MEALLKKLNFKLQKNIFVLNAPNDILFLFADWKEVAFFSTKCKAKTELEFVLLFVTSEKEIETFMATIENSLTDETVLWLCYPKKSSKKYTSTIYRDYGWEPLGKLHYEPVRGVALDEDWSALRFKKVHTIATMKRKSGALSDEGKKRIIGN